MLLQHLGRHDLAVQPLLQVVERRDRLLAAHQQLAVEHAVEVDRLDDVGEGARHVLAGAAVEPLDAARRRRPARGCRPISIRRGSARDRACRVRRARSGWPASAAGRRRPCCVLGLGPSLRQPVEQRPIGRRERVPDLLDLGDRLVADIGGRLLGEPRRDADAQRAGQQLQQRPAAGRIERIEPALEDRRRLHLGRALQRLDDLAERGRRAGLGLGLPDQRQRLGEVADIVVGPVEQLRRRSCPRRSCAAAPAWPRGSRARRSAPPAPSRDRDRASAAGRSRSAAAWRCAPAGRTAHRAAAAKACMRQAYASSSPRGRRGAAPRPRCRSSGRSAPAPPRGRASPRPWARRRPSGSW